MNTPPARHVSRRTVLRGAATLAGMAIVSPLLVACGGAAATPAGGLSATVPISGAASAVAATPKIGGVLTYAQNQPIKTLDSLNPQTYPASYEAIYALYNTLVSFAPDLKIVPALAERWERSADNLTWTFHLRSGVKFHDGTPFNAQAVVAHVKRIQDPKNASPNKNLWDHIVDTKVVDDTTVQLITGKPFGAMLNYLAHSSGGIASPDAVAKYGADYPTHPVGTGPYQLSAFNAGTDLTLVRNESFYGGKPRLDRVIFRSVTETGSRVALIDAGEADLANDVPAEEAGRLAKGTGTQLLRQQGMRAFFMEFNLTLPIFKDQKVRQALNYAVNKEAIATSLFQGYAQVLDSPAAGTMQGHKKCGAYPYDAAKAKQMLADAGWKAGPAGILQKDGTPLKFAINTAEGEYPKDIQVVEAVQADLKAVGCDVSIWKVEAAARYSYLRLPSSEAKYEMVSFGFNPSNGDLGYHLNSLFRSNPDKTKAPYVWNLMWYENQQVDTLLTQAEQSVDDAGRADLLGQVQQIVWDEAPMIWLYAPDLLVAAQKSVQGVYVWPTIFTIVRDAWKS